MKNSKSKTSITETAKPTLAKRLLIYIGRFFIWFFCTLLVLLVGLYFLLLYVNKGPSPYVRNLLFLQ